MVYFTLLMSNIEVKGGKHHYQGIKLWKYNKYFSAVKESCHKAIVAGNNNMESRFLILTLQVPSPQNGQTHSKNLSLVTADKLFECVLLFKNLVDLLVQKKILKILVK